MSKQVAEALFKKIRAHVLYGLEIPNYDYNKISDYLNNLYGYENAKTDFVPVYYHKFHDWFLRRLTRSKYLECKENARRTIVCSPVQGQVRKKVPFGRITLKESYVGIDHLLHITKGHHLCQISLFKTDYHRVHSPVDGVIIDIRSYGVGEFFKDSDALVLIEIENENGLFTLLCIGELTVESFIPIVKIGQSVSKVEELGHFYFGSQVILVMPETVDILVDMGGKKRVFIGDMIC